MQEGKEGRSADEFVAEAIHERALELIAEEQDKASAAEAFEGITEDDFEEAALEHAMELVGE
jgi:hypothetical protein